MTPAGQTKCELARSYVKSHTLSFPATGGWGNWGEVATVVELHQGMNEIRLTSMGNRTAGGLSP